MSSLSYLEKSTLEKLFEMGSGYVLNFSNHTFDMFVGSSTGKDIRGDEYVLGSGSKANRLRAFWDKEPDHVVAKLLGDLLDYIEHEEIEYKPKRMAAARGIVERLTKSTEVAGVEVLSETLDELESSVRESIENRRFQAGLSHLHTFATRFVRRLCDRHGISTQGGARGVE